MRQAARLAAWEDESGTTAFVEYAVVDVLSFKGGSSPGRPFRHDKRRFFSEARATPPATSGLMTSSSTLTL
jgi:hypothetical protein